MTRLVCKYNWITGLSVKEEVKIKYIKPHGEYYMPYLDCYGNVVAHVRIDV